MALTLGIDTGGTYTDAVLFDTDAGVIASAKALTTKHDLTIGVREAIDAVLGGRGAEVALVSISTTLATNAIVEGQGSPAALVLIGHPAGDRERPDLKRALGSDPLIAVGGGHDALGDARQPFDGDALAAQANIVKERVSAFAVSSMFAVRNPAHEIAARDLLHAQTGLPVSCAHELSSQLDAPRRALTALLNARLISLIQGLIRAVEGLMADRAISAPVMVVKGDGSLVDAATALRSPVETILSGPAASVVGAQHLARLDDAFVSDIGGTTTDIALVKDGRPQLDPLGARVGGYRTMVRAVAVHTFGLGGDSEVRLNDRGRLTVGPRRAVPLSLLAKRYPQVIATLEAQAERGWPAEWDGAFVLRQRALDTDPASLSRPQQRIWDALEEGPASLEWLYSDQSPTMSLARLLDRGLVIMSRLTPSDASHLLGFHHGWERRGAELGARLWLRWWKITGHDTPGTPEDLARLIVDTTVTASARALLESAMIEEHRTGLPTGSAGDALVNSAISDRAGDLLRLQAVLGRTIVAVGAPAATYYPEIARRLSTGVVVPEHAEVCNAVGAVAGGVAQRVDALITSPSEGLYRCHMPEGIADFRDLESAAGHAQAEIGGRARRSAEAIGAVDIQLKMERHDEVVRAADGSVTFIECRLSALASGRPALATG